MLGRVLQCSARFPILGPALAVIAAVGIADNGFWGWWFLLSFSLVVAFFGRRNLLGFTLCFALLGGGLHWSRLEKQNSIEREYGSWWEFEAVVEQDPTGQSVLVRSLDDELARARLRVWLGPRAHSLEVGDVLSLRGRIVEPRERLNPQTFPEKTWLYRQGVSAAFVAQSWEETQHSVWSLKRTAVEVRDWLKQRLLMGVDPNSVDSKIIVAMALGERPVDAQELLDAYRLSGAIHVFAVSGLHVMMVGGMVAFILKMLGMPRWAWVSLVIISMLFYALVTGLRPPALRAAVMGAILLGAWVVGRKVVLVNSIAVGVVVALLIDGHMLFRPGFQLSFAVLLAIALLGEVFGRVFHWVSYMDPFLPRSLYTRVQELWLIWRRKIQAGLVVASSAWVGSSPFTFFHFGVVTPMSIIVSLPVVALLYCSLCLGALSIVLGVLWSPLGEALNVVNSKVAASSHVLVDFASKVPASHFKSAPWSHGERVVIYALEDGASATYLGIGGGVMLDLADERQFRREVLPSLVKNGARIDSVILSHGDYRHIGGSAVLMGNYAPKQILVGDRSRGLNDVFSTQILTTAEAGGKYALSQESYVEVILWSDRVEGVADDRCPVFMLHWNGKRVLFLQDVGYRFENWLLASEQDLAADVIVWSGHSKDELWGDDLIQKVQARWVIGPKALSTKLAVTQIELQQSGAIEIKEAEQGLSAEGFRKGHWELD
ncbi:ComEC/Rec2 family competence protein [Rubritalea sp.]|uniref:ComEC/Rec2 family competence protein n=1 Tax=Rubritalea sp. TaxID=2109375 RepID=UPI003F4AC712